MIFDIILKGYFWDLSEKWVGIFHWVHLSADHLTWNNCRDQKWLHELWPSRKVATRHITTILGYEMWPREMWPRTPLQKPKCLNEWSFVVWVKSGSQFMQTLHKPFLLSQWAHFIIWISMTHHADYCARCMFLTLALAVSDQTIQSDFLSCLVCGILLLDGLPQFGHQSLGLRHRKRRLSPCFQENPLV